MKKFKEVEKNRTQYHREPNINSVHRSSLLVPEIDGATTEISFVNHFLLKRSYDNIACRVTGIDQNGKKIHSNLYKISEPKVYKFNLSEIFDKKAKSYIVEFFSPENLFIPFPAVMVNHYGDGFLNTVHAYNRVLNDVFEDDAINEVKVKESSIDVQVDENTDTFILFNAGQIDFKGKIQFELLSASNDSKIEKEIDVKRFNAEKFSIGELFNVTNINNNAVLKISQPTQQMFYGRLFSGQVKKDSGAFSANHSYYDSSLTEEYWDNNLPSSRIYPFFQGLKNIVRFHPIASKSSLKISAILHGKKGENLARAEAGIITSPVGEILEFNINDICVESNINTSDVSSFEVIATPVNGNTPTRIGHQIVHQSGDALYSSINISLCTPNSFTPVGKKSVSWGQLIVADNVTSYLGIISAASMEKEAEVNISFYGENGKLGESNYTIFPGASVNLDTESDLNKITFNQENHGNNIWYIITSDVAGIYAVTVSKHKETNNCTGEHSF